MTNNNSRVINDNMIKIPKVGYIKAKVHRMFDDNYKLKSVTFSRDSDLNTILPYCMNMKFYQ